MNDVNCKGSIRMKCIGKAANVIKLVTYFSDENDDNKDITKKIATTLLNCDGIDTLINASEEYAGGDDIPQLRALSAVWCAITILTCHDSLMSQEQAITIFDTGIDIISQVKSVDNSIASKILGNVIFTFNNIVYENYVTKKYFQDKNILSKCLEVFKKNGAWDCKSREEVAKFILFFNRCRIKNLLDGNLDHEKILPLLVVVLKKFPSDDEIREYAMVMMNYSCSTINDKNKILRSGVMDSLGVLLASENIDVDEKNNVRTLINKIIA